MSRRKPPKGGRGAAPSSRSKAGRRRRGSFPRGVALVVAGLALFAFGAYFGGRLLERLPAQGTPLAKTAAQPVERRGAKSAAVPGKLSGKASAKSAPPQPATPAAASAPGRAESGPLARVAIVIDDLGRDVENIAALTAIGASTAGRSSRPVQLSYAVLPFESHTSEVLEALRRHGGEILLHLPMDPEGRENPGPGALTAQMSGRELAEATEAALAAVPGAVGVNNHMGSKLTSERAAMRAILAVVHGHGLYFLDSRTTAESVGFAVAREAGVPAAEREFFLDDELGRSAIAAQFARLLARAREEGAAIAIAHPHPSTLAVLAEEIPRAVAAGFEFVPVSYLLERSEELPE